MFLSRIELGARAPERSEFWEQVSQPYGAHQALWRLFKKGPAGTRSFLFRAEESRGRPSFLVLSADTPVDDGAGLWHIETKSFAPELRSGQRLGFRLRASPVVRRGQVTENGLERSRRHDVVMDLKKRIAAGSVAPLPPSELIRVAGTNWLQDQAGRSGFRLDTVAQEVIGEDGLLDTEQRPAVRVDGYRQHKILRRGEKAITFSSIDFEGVLEVVDPKIFLARVIQGLGPQKAFGCGLMLLRRA